MSKIDEIRKRAKYAVEITHFDSQVTSDYIALTQDIPRLCDALEVAMEKLNLEGMWITIDDIKAILEGKE